MSSSEPIEVGVVTVKEWLDARRDIALVDCREQSEYDTASIGDATLIPMSRWAEAGPQLNALRDKHIVVHCHHGGRSLRVAQWLRDNGFPNAQSMAGGIDAWSQLIDPTVPRY